MSDTRKNNYLTIPTPGNGQSNCFYNAIMLAIIHDILADQLDEETPVAQAIQSIVLPQIAEKLKELTGFTFYFEDQPLKKSIFNLLHIVSLKNNEPFLSESEEISAIKRSHLPILLKEVCAPVLRQITCDGAGHAAVSTALKSVLETEFHAQLKSSHPFDLCLTDDEHTAAVLQQKNDDFSGLPEDFQTNIRTSWDKKYAEKHTQQPGVPVNLGKAFNEWWDTNQNSVCTDYFTLKDKNNAPAGLPEQVALEQQLCCSIGVFNQSTQRIDPLYKAAPHDENQHVFVLDASQAFHFNAIVENTEIGAALAEHMQDLAQDAALNEAEYNCQDFELSIPLALNEETEKVIDQTKVLITEIETYPDWKNNLSKAETDIIKAAKDGYYQARLFSTPAETEDLEYAIKLQNEELNSFFTKRFNR